MNCKKAHQQIYLFTELTEEERELVLHHINACKQCTELFASVQILNNAMKRVSIVTIEPSDSFQLTNKIMHQINTLHQPLNVLDWILHYFELGQVKFALAGISILLIFLFGFEQMQLTQNSSQYSYQWNVTSQAVILNAKKFQDQLNVHKRSEKALRLNECKNPFKSPYLNVACFRNKNIHFKIL